MAEYNKQNFTGAADLADVAYIDNFEFLEAPRTAKRDAHGSDRGNA